jgi:hypothetical protein
MAEKIAGFKKFSDFKKSSSKVEEVSLSEITPDTDSDRPMTPNLPNDSDKIERIHSRKGIMPVEQNISLGTENFPGEDDDEYPVDLKLKKENVKTYGRVAKFPKNVKASNAFNFLENVKVSKKSIWYIIVEKQENELQMVKYNNKEGVDLNKFIIELKSYYIKKYSKDQKVCKMIEGLSVGGNDKYSMVKNIPLITVDGRKMITIITEDLIKLLSK